MLTALIFYPQSPFRGEITANTLFGAICWGIRKFYGESEIKNFLKEYKSGNPPFVFSSPLPIDKEGKPWFFRPPLEGSIFDNSNREELKRRYPVSKRFKKLSLIEWDILKKILSGEIKSEKELFGEILKKLFPKEGNAEDKDPQEVADALEKYTKEAPKLKETTLTVKTPINRLTFTAQEGQLHNEVVNVYNPFAVLFKVYNQRWFEKAKVALKVVRLGGNKTVGLGRFEFEENKEIIPEGLENFTNKGKRVYLLSPATPTTYIDIERSLYEVKIERSAVDKSLGYFDPSFVNLPVWKKAITYLKEGSILTLKEPLEVVGSLRETLKVGDSAIYAYGLGFCLSFLG